MAIVYEETCTRKDNVSLRVERCSGCMGSAFIMYGVKAGSRKAAELISKIEGVDSANYSPAFGGVTYRIDNNLQNLQRETAIAKQVVEVIKKCSQKA